MEFPLWALSLKTFHNTQSPSKTFWSHPFWDCCVYVQSCAHGHLLKGKTVLVALQVGFAGQPQQGKRPNKKAKYTEQLWGKDHWCCCESSATSTTNLFHAAVRTTYLETWSWLFAMLKPSTGTAEGSLFNGKLPSLHRNHPKYSLNLTP